MKNRLFLFCLMAAMVVSCVKEQQETIQMMNADQVFHATIEDAGDPGTRVYADDQLRVLWNADDHVSIFNKTTYNREYAFQGKDGDNSGTFKKVPTEDFVTSNPLDYVYSVYPYNENTSISNDGEITVYLPAEQSYREDSFGLGANTMIAITEEDELMFKNLCGYFAIKLYGDNVSVSSITLKGNNNELLAGKATVVAQMDAAPTIQFDTANATKELTLTCATPVTLGTTAETATTFWFIIPPTTFENGFKVIVNDSDNGVFEKSSHNSLEIKRNTLKRSQALEVKTINPNEAIAFADNRLKAVLVKAFDTNNDSDLSYAEAAAVSDPELIMSACDTAKFFQSFDEFQYFTNITTIPEKMFYSWRFASVVIPESVTSIGKSAFRWCTSLRSIIVPNSITSIGSEAFYGCYSLESFTIPGGVTVIERDCFYGCRKLLDITIPSSVTSIGLNAFRSCSGLNNITIPESVSSIGSGAFSDCSSLKSITLPDGITAVSYQCFDGCKSLVNINIPSSVSSIDGLAFRSCTSLSSIILPRALTTIGGNAFADCSNLSSICLPETLTAINAGAFENCTSFESIVIPANVTAVGSSAFEGCSGLASITVTSPQPPTGGNKMFDATNDCPIFVPASSVEAYKTAQYWSQYADRIQPLAPLPEAVDLGLPSGLKWALCNLGASKPEEYGDYFAWGEIEPYYTDGHSQDNPCDYWRDGKTEGYNWASYKWCNGSSTTLTKYNTSSSFGFVDNNSTLELADDCANVLLGGSWRIPSQKEVNELLDNCSVVWTNENGVAGRRFTSKIDGYSDKSIFIPASGRRKGLTIDEFAIGYYWTSSLDINSPDLVYYMGFNSSVIFCRYSGTRFSGLSIRPVCE